MASIFKRSKRRNAPYVIQYTDHEGKRKTIKGFTDRGLTEQLAAKLESEARLRKTGLIDVQQERLAATRQLKLQELLVKFAESLADNSPQYVQLTVGQVRRIIAGAKFETLADINAEAVETYLKERRKTEETGNRTYNQYLQAFGTFCNWCVATKRLVANPLAGIERLNTEIDVRHARRALTAAEVGRLLESARNSGVKIQGFNGEQRARIYLMSYLTGLRRKELASLTVRSFSLDTHPATMKVEAQASKHRKKDVLPLHPELVVLLRGWLQGMQPHERLFPKLGRRKTWIMVQKDLKRCGIKYKTEEGIADFHAAGRHTYVTELLRSGASLAEAKELARHSDIKTTMRYTHIGLADQARAVAALPMPQAEKHKQEPTPDAALQMRCNPRGAEEQSVAPNGTTCDPPKRQNPRRSKGLVTVCQRVALADEIGATRHR